MELICTLLVLGLLGALIGAAAMLSAPLLDRVEDWMEDLFSYQPSPRSGASIKAVATSPTSTAAAAEIKSAASDLREAVFLCLREHGPQTDEQMQERLRMNGSTQRPRRVELWEAGLIEQCGTRPTRSGRSAVVWRVKANEDLIAAE